MLRFALGRLLQAIPVLLVVITMTFLLVHSAPGGPFSADKAVPEEVLEALEAQYNLNQPLWQQYVNYLGDVLQGDMLTLVGDYVDVLGGPALVGRGRLVAGLIAHHLQEIEADAVGTPHGQNGAPVALEGRQILGLQAPEVGTRLLQQIDRRPLRAAAARLHGVIRLEGPGEGVAASDFSTARM